MPNVVVDTTVLISGFITPKGVSAKLLEQAETGSFTLCLSRQIIEELRSRLLHRERIRRRYQYDDRQVYQYCRDIEATNRLITDAPAPRLMAATGQLARSAQFGHTCAQARVWEA